MDFAAGRPTDRHPPFRFSAIARVWFSDIDSQGIVYYGRYMPYFDNARIEYHRHLDLPPLRAEGTEFVVKALNVEYEAPARFDDLLEVFVRTRRIGRTSTTSEFAAYRVADDRLMCTAVQTHVLLDAATRRPTPVADAYRAAIAAFEGAGLESASEGPFPA